MMEFFMSPPRMFSHQEVCQGTDLVETLKESKRPADMTWPCLFDAVRMEDVGGCALRHTTNFRSRFFSSPLWGDFLSPASPTSRWLACIPRIACDPSQPRCRAR